MDKVQWDTVSVKADEVSRGKVMGGRGDMEGSNRCMQDLGLYPKISKKPLKYLSRRTTCSELHFGNIIGAAM